MYKSKTLRRMQPTTRRYARLINELESVLRRLDNLKPEIARLELDASALFNQQIHERVMKQVEDFDNDRRESNGAELEKRIDAAEIFYDPALKDLDQEIIPGRIHWEKVSTTHVVLDPKTGDTEIRGSP